MGRWLNRIDANGKNTGMPVWQTDTTDETLGNKVVSVSSASQKRDLTFFAIAGGQLTASDYDAFEERAAILEYEEGLPRTEAEWLAVEQISNVPPFKGGV